MINVLIVDDHELIQMGIAGLLDGEPGITVLGYASSGEEAIKKFEYLNPDVILLDVNMPGMGGVETLKRLQEIKPSLRVIILTVHTSGGLPAQLMNLGAQGYLSKGCGHKELVNAIRHVSRGEHYIGQGVASTLSHETLSGNGPSPFNNLSAREMQIILLILQGEDIQAIAEMLGVGIKTINTYRYRAFEKLAVRNDVELVACATRYGLQFM